MMDIDTMKVEVEAETCCICNSVSEELYSPEEYDAGAPPSQAPLRSMLMHITHNKTVPSGQLCSGCISRTLEAYNFSTMLTSKGPPPLSEKIRALRKRLYELSQKIDVFIVVGGGAGGAYSSEDIILVEPRALAAAAAQHDARGLPGHRCSVCPAFFQRASEYRAHMSTHPADAAHWCWSCGARFPSPARLQQHAARCLPPPARRLVCATDGCVLRFHARSDLLAHIRKCHGSPPPPPPPAPAVPCPHCARTFATPAAMKRHVRVHRDHDQDQQEEQAEWQPAEGEEYLELDALEDIDELS